FREGQPILARPVGRRERVSRWCRRNPVLASLLAVLALVVLAGLVGLGIATTEFREQAAVQRRLAVVNEQARLRAEETRDETDTARSKLARTLVDMHAAQGLMAGERGDPAQAVLWFA